MNQEKTGKFIAISRKKLNITQQELANKLGVTDKAVSKWENGRGLMDISLLKPLSEILNVSIIELINGELMDNVALKEEPYDIIEYSVCYTKEKINISRIRTIFAVIISILLLVILSFIFFKSIMLKKYTVEQIHEYENIIKKLDFTNSIEIYKKIINENEYLIFPEFKIRNDFSDFKTITELEDYEILKYLKFDEYDNLEAAFRASKDNQLIEKFKKNFDEVPIGEDAIFIDEDREYFLIKNNINNDLDFLNYINQKYYLNSNLFTSLRQMEENYNFNNFVQISLPDIKKSAKIIGDYEGYIFDVQEDIREVHILKNNKDYIFTFIGEEMIKDEYIVDLLSTLKFK